MINFSTLAFPQLSYGWAHGTVVDSPLRRHCFLLKTYFLTNDNGGSFFATTTFLHRSLVIDHKQTLINLATAVHVCCAAVNVQA
jgi:hypothetical protein